MPSGFQDGKERGAAAHLHAGALVNILLQGWQVLIVSILSMEHRQIQHLQLLHLSQMLTPLNIDSAAPSQSWRSTDLE